MQCGPCVPPFLSKNRYLALRAHRAASYVYLPITCYDCAAFLCVCAAKEKKEGREALWNGTGSKQILKVQWAKKKPADRDLQRTIGDFFYSLGKLKRQKGIYAETGTTSEERGGREGIQT